MSDQGVHLEFDAILSEGRQRAGGLDDLGDGPFLAPLTWEAMFPPTGPRGNLP